MKLFFVGPFLYKWEMPSSSHLPLITSAFITGRQTEWILTMLAWNKSLQSTKSGLFKYCSLANTDSWAPPNNLISLLLFPQSSSCPHYADPSRVCGVFFPSGSLTICHFPTFSIPLLCNGINISQAAPQPFFLLTNWRRGESFQPAKEQ